MSALRVCPAVIPPFGEHQVWISRSIVAFFVAFLRDKSELAVENVALRQQLAVLQHSARRPKLRRRDRIFWVWLSKLWTNWRSALLIVKPETVVVWHRQGFRLYLR